MRFRVLLVIFNATIIVSFLLIFLMPVFVLGWDYTSLFWSRNWSLGVMFAAIIAGVNIYFGSNRAVFRYLENEQWDELAAYLEGRLDAGHRLTVQRLRLMVNAYVVGRQPEKITALEERLRISRPRAIPRLALELGVPYLLNSNAVEMERFFGEMKTNPRCSDPRWIHWNYAFALMLQKKLDEAGAELISLVADVKSPVQMLLTGYLADPLTENPDVRRVVDDLRARLTGRYTRVRLEELLSRHRNNLQVLVLSQLIRDAVEWLYRDGKEDHG